MERCFIPLDSVFSRERKRTSTVPGIPLETSEKVSRNRDLRCLFVVTGKGSHGPKQRALFSSGHDVAESHKMSRFTHKTGNNRGGWSPRRPGRGWTDYLFSTFLPVPLDLSKDVADHRLDSSEPPEGAL